MELSWELFYKEKCKVKEKTGKATLNIQNKFIIVDMLYSGLV